MKYTIEYIKKTKKNVYVFLVIIIMTSIEINILTLSNEFNVNNVIKFAKTAKDLEIQTVYYVNENNCRSKHEVL